MRLVKQLGVVSVIALAGSQGVAAVQGNPVLTLVLGMATAVLAVIGYAWVVRRTERRAPAEVSVRGAAGLGQGTLIGVALFSAVEAKDGADLDNRYRMQINAKKGDPTLWEELYHPGKAPGIGIYTKGPLALHALRRQVGDQAFHRLIKQWPQEHRGDYVGWPQFEAFAEKTTGQDLTGFFRAWFRGATLPADEYLWRGALKP